MSAELHPGEVRRLLGRHMLADGLPLVLDLEGSEGAYLRDAESGRHYLDFFSSFSTCPIGFNHPRLHESEFRRALLPAAINKISNSDLYTLELAHFVERFATTLPAAFRSHLFFIEGGALAVENALKAAFDWKKQLNLKHGRSAEGSQIIHFRQAFHGRSGYTLSLTNTDPRKTDYFPKFDWPRILSPSLSLATGEGGMDTVKTAEADAIAQIHQAIERHPGDIAALIIEPIQGEGGDHHFRREFLRQLRRVADDHELLLIFDEVQTGFSTTGRWWCFEHFDVEPDILVFGKKTQVCGIAATSRIDEVHSVFQTASRINSTWGGNLVDMIRCRRIIEVIEQEELLDNAARIGARLLAGLEELAARHEIVSNPRGRGMFLAFDLPDAATRDALLDQLFSVGLLALPSGERALRFRPPVNLSADEADEGLAYCESVLSKGLIARASR